MPLHRWSLVWLAACAGDPRAPRHDATSFVDRSVVAGFTERSTGQYARGRGCTVADFDGDGLLEFVSSNPGDPTLLARNTTQRPGEARFSVEALSEGNLHWGAGVVDIDGDRDLDVFSGTGGNEGEALDVVFRNDGGALVETDPGAPLSGPFGVVGDAVPTATAGVRWADLDLDGDTDLFLSTNVLDIGQYDDYLPIQPHGRDRLLLNDGGGAWRDAGLDAGLEARDASFQSTLFDYDNDGDVDLYQHVIVGLSHVWRNELVETGELRFTDVTWEVSPNDGVRMVDPLTKSFSSAASDLNNDGWTDLIVWHRGPTGPGNPMDWHLVWLNLGGERFVEVGRKTGMAARWHECEDVGRGVMGSQVADIDGDGFPDVFVGNGSPDGGCVDHLFVSNGLVPMEVPGWGTIQVPTFRDESHAIDLPVEGADEVPYPYRTHGACFADYDDDGRPELAWVNGGPADYPDYVREPDRYFDVMPRSGWHFVTVRPVGDGVTVAFDAVGTRARMKVRRTSDGTEWEVYQTLYGGSGFSAHNGPDLFLGMADADEVVELELTWPDGVVEALPIDGLDRRYEVRR